ncbi:MAG TPA: cytochrome c3 family protein [Thermoleophilia bacterium]|nr:cytochrome c3 family protein [Thermoleophilia bacterium]
MTRGRPWTIAIACAVLVAAIGVWAPAALASAAAPTISATNPGASGANGSATGPSGNEECFACHGVKPVDGSITVDGKEYPATIDVNGQQKSIYVDRSIQSNSRHGELACISCHIGFNAGEHPASVTEGWLKTAKFTACGNCHSEEMKMYASSFHGDLVLNKDSDKAPLCGDCHDAHNIVPPESAAFRAQEMQLCGRCHADAKKTYLNSYHGKAYLLGSTRTAVCSQCHGGHKILPASDPDSMVSRQHVVATCGQCHPGANKNFADFRAHVNPSDPRSSWQIWIFWIAYVLLITVVFTFAAVHTSLYIYRGFKDGLYSRPRHRDKRGDTRIEYQRFNVFHRWMHFLVIVSFTVLVFTGMPLKYKSTPWAKWSMDLFGGVTAAGVYHRLAAIVTIAYWCMEMIYMVVQVARARGRNLTGPDSMMFRRKDLEDLVGMFAWFFGRGPKPQFDRYTYWEKFDYISLGVGTVIIGVTGLMMWFPLKTTELVPGIFLNIALVIHSNEALLAMGVIFIFVHFFSAHLRPESFPIDKVIFTGTLPVDHYREDRPLEYARRVREGTLDEVLVERKITWKTLFSDGLWWLITLVMGFFALLMTAFIIWSIFT